MNLVERMPRVCKAVIKAKGGYLRNLKYKISFDLFNTFLVTTWFHMCYFFVLMSSLLFYNVESSKNKEKHLHLEWHCGLRHCITVLSVPLEILVRIQALSQPTVTGRPMGQCTIGPMSSGLQADYTVRSHCKINLEIYIIQLLHPHCSRTPTSVWVAKG